MEAYICETCGLQHSPSDNFPSHCIICEDDRQYIGRNGQQWTTLARMQTKYHHRIEMIEDNLYGIGSEPGFAIGQRALLIRTPRGNVLWDCTSLLDDATITAIENLGGISAIAVSHPHLAGSLVEWSHAFGHAPIYWHAKNRAWVTRPDPAYIYWEQQTQPLLDGLTLVCCGGHFPGSAVLHWAGGAGGHGALLTGDTITVVQDRRFVSFMYSYPNIIPLSAPAVNRIVNAVEPFIYDRIYGGWWDAFIPTRARQAVISSAERYIRAINLP